VRRFQCHRPLLGARDGPTKRRRRRR
jgi:hypothetical protein